MSTTVDSRVVEMRFDNKQFENGVATSMSTLEKLKQKLNLSGASKGLENIGSAAKNVSFAGMNAGIDTVHAKFSALQVVGVTALANITNSAVNAGKRIAKALTIDPIKTGFEEYELKMNSVQTIMSNTASKGTTMSDVTKTLEELNTYADKTIYNFAEMTRNIGTFTAAGVGLEESAAAIKGIANLAAASGSSSQQASTAMYQLSQALAAGTVKLMDWNSVVNAGMGGEKFQEALKATAREHGIAVDSIIEKNGSFRDSLQDGWISADILNETLNKFTVDGAKNYAKAMMDSGKWTQEQADALIKEAQSMEDAATKVKTFTQLWDTMKESVQSGWAQTWEILLGDFEEAKELFSGLSDFFGKFISKSADTRNSILEGALSGNPFTKLAERIEKVTAATDKLSDATEKVKGATKDYGALVDKIIGGEFGNGEARFKALTEAGYDWAHAQNLVNEKLGDSTRYATDYKEAQEEVSKAQKVTIDDLLKMSDAQLKNLGFTKDEVEAFRELEEQSKKTGIPVKDLINDIDQLNGRTLLINAFKNAGQGLVAVFTSVGKAWKEAFYGDASDEEIIAKKTESLYNMIAAIHKFSTYLTVSDETADKLTRTFKGLFAIVDILTTILGGGFKLAFTGLSKILGAFDMDILDLTANIGDAIVAFRDFLFDNQLVNKGFELLAVGIKKAIDAIKDFCDAFLDIPQVQEFINDVKEALENIKDIDLSEVGRNIIEGLQNGLGDGVQAVWDKMVEIGQGIIDAIKGILGIHSPSTVMMAIGGFIIAGLILGLKMAFPDVWDNISQFGSDLIDKFTEVVNNIPWSKLFAAGVAVAMTWFVKKIADAIGGIANAFDGIGDLFENAGKVLKSFSKVLNGISWDFKAKAIQKLAISIAILVGSVIALSFIDSGKLWNSVGVIVALSAVLGVLAFATNKMSEASVEISRRGASVNGLKTGLIAIGASLLLLSATVKIVGSLKPEQAIQGFVGLTALMTEMIVFMAACGKFVKGDTTENMDKIGGMMLKLSIALALMVGVCKLVSGLSADEMIQGAVFATAFGAFVIAITKVAKTSGNNVSKVGGLMIKLAIAMGLMVGVIKMVDLLSAEEMLKGVAFAAAFTLFVKDIVGVTKIGRKQQIAKLGGMMLGISTSIMLMVGVCKLVGMLSVSDIAKGIAFISGFVVLIKVLVGVLTIGSEQQMGKVAASILAMSVAVGVLAAVSIALSLIDLAGLTKGVIAVGLLGGIMTAMIWATRGANDVKGNLIVMSVAIGVMAGAVAALSLIDTSKLVGASAALTMLMGMFALMAKASGIMGRAMGSITIMTIAVGALASILYLLSSLEPGPTLEIAASLSLLLLSLAESMEIIDNVGPRASAAIGPLVALTVISGLIGLMLAGLSKLDPGPTLEIAASLSAVLLAMSASALILSKVGPLASAALPGATGLLILVGAAGLVLATVGGLLALLPDANEFFENGIPILEKIGSALGAFVGGIVGGFSEGVADSLPIISDKITEFINNFSKVEPNAIEGIETVLGVMTKMAGVNIIDSLSTIFSGGSTPMETFKENLTSFVDAIATFSSKLGEVTIDEDAITKAANVGKIMSELQSSISMTGPVVSFFANSNNLGTFGLQLVAFGSAISSFSNSLVQNGGIDEGAVTAAANAGKIMSELQSGISMSGPVIDFFGNSNNLGVFGLQLVAYGRAISSFSKSLVEGGGVDEAAITAAANAGRIMNELQSSVSMSGPVIDFFANSNNLGTFGIQLVAYGSAISSFSRSLVEGGGIDETAITAAANAGKIMSELQNSVSMTGPVLSFFSKSDNLALFGLQIVAFGKAISAFSKSVTGENAIDEGAVTAAANAGKVMASLQKAIPDDKWFDGKVSIDEFGQKIKKFGKYISDYSDNVSEINTDAISSSATQAKRLVSIAKSVVDLDVDSIGKFESIKKIGAAIKGYADKVAGIESGTVSASIGAIRNLISLINSMAGLDTSGVGSFTTAINNLSKVQISGVVKAFSGAASQLSNIGGDLIISLAKGMQSKQGILTSSTTSIINFMVNTFKSRTPVFQTIGSTLMTRFVSGIRSQNGKVASAATSSLSTAASRMRGYYSSFYSSGAYVASGFAAGIRSKIDSAAAAAAAMASAASKAARNNLQIHSPSRVFKKIGSYIPQGFAIGISSFGRMVRNSTSSMTKTAVSGAEIAMSRIGSVLDSDMDIQPTIRPVLDLSDIKSGAGYVNSLFKDGSTIGISANMDRLSVMMNRNDQNTGNYEIVSAINKLRADLGKLERPSYNINGITYDDGSNITEAVETLIRAARVGRRM